MLKLTGINVPRVVYVKPSLIEWMMRWDERNTTEVRVAGNSFMVVETPEQILEIPEMMMEIYPAFELNGGKVRKIT